MKPVRLLLAALLGAAGGSARADGEEVTRFINVRVGDRAPTFACKDDAGRTWRSADHYGRRVLVVSFVLGDFFPECTRQACGLRDELAKIRAEGADVVLVSGDSPATRRLFRQVYRLGYTLLSDHDGKVGVEWGVPMSGGGVRRVKLPDGKELTVERGATAARWTFIVGKDGRVLDRNSAVRPDGHGREVLAVLKRHNRGR